MEHKNYFIGAILLVVAAFTFWLAQQSEESATAFKPQSHTPDYYFQGVTATVMNLQGEPSQTLVAEKMIHYPDDDSTELQRPNLTIFDNDNPPWKVVSESGWISGDGEVLLLNGKVKIDRRASSTIRAMHMTTQDLRIQPKENYAETDADVHAWSHGDIIDAKGMQAWFNTPIRIKLLANVRGHYVIQKK